MQGLIHKIQFKNIYIKGVLFSLLFLFMSMPILVNAGGLGSWKSKLDTGAKASGVNTDTDNQSLDLIIETVIKTILSFLGVIFLILMIYGGFLWMTARGNEDQVVKSKNLIIAAVIGLIIVLASYAISFFVFNSLSSETLDFG